MATTKKDHDESEQAPKQASQEQQQESSGVSHGDSGQADLQARVDKENAQGFVGVEVDPTPNEHYTVAGVAAGKPTPETDDESARKASEHGQKVNRGEV